MRDPVRDGHILVWMRDAALADRLCRAVAHHGLTTTWAAALPEAIGSLDRHFPRAVVCTLRGKTPSLIDLETLLAYQVLGHSFICLPQVPIWALTPDPERYAGKVADLGIPIHLVPDSAGSEDLLEGMATAGLLEAPRRRPAGEAEGSDLLLVLPHLEEGRYLSRYLERHGFAVTLATDPWEALGLLRRRSFRVLVSGDFAGRRDGGSYWHEIEARWGCLPVLLLAGDEAWQAQVAPQELPRGIAGMLPRPVPAAALEACLRRLLRRPAPGRPAAVAAR